MTMMGLRLFSRRYAAVVGVATAGMLVSSALTSPYATLLVSLTALFVGGGTLSVVRSQPSSGSRLRRAPIAHTIVPATLAFGGALFTLQLLGVFYRPLGMALTSGGVALAVYCQYVLAAPLDHKPAYRTRLPDGQAGRPAFARLVTDLSVYLAAFLLFVVLLNTGLDSLLSALGLGIVSGLLCLELFQGAEDDPRRAALYSGVVGVLMAQVSWVLHYESFDHVVTGLLLLLGFYLLSGLVHNHLLNRLSRGVALEFIGVTVIGLGLLYAFRALSG